MEYTSLAWARVNPHRLLTQLLPLPQIFSFPHPTTLNPLPSHYLSLPILSLPPNYPTILPLSFLHPKPPYPYPNLSPTASYPPTNVLIYHGDGRILVEKLVGVQ